MDDQQEVRHAPPLADVIAHRLRTGILIAFFSVLFLWMAWAYVKVILQGLTFQLWLRMFGLQVVLTPPGLAKDVCLPVLLDYATLTQLSAYQAK